MKWDASFSLDLVQLIKLQACQPSNLKDLVFFVRELPATVYEVSTIF